MNLSRQDPGGSKSRLLFWLLPVPVIVWLALLLAPCLTGNLLTILDSLPDALSRPWEITLGANTARTVLVFLLLYAGGAGVYLSSRPKLREGEEHGSARWGSPGELNRMIAQKESFSTTATAIKTG